MRSIAEDLGIVGAARGTLRHWLDLYGTGKKTAVDGTLTRSPLKPPGGASSQPSDEGGPVHDEPPQH